MEPLLAVLSASVLLVAAIAAVGSLLPSCATEDTHRPPDEPFTIEQAHRVMQRHRPCRAVACPRKQAAFRTLVASGRVVPDSRADGYCR
ncbi:hypothetical protein OHB12_21195 [Nocardia sp. NBC_01730]|uniref:hypothetical protein n=1 Tax=Nocardia sp. NBC_01730 TaxID=2975998 RepID=UPI002E145C16|nr:hypothetical protein OHB12_21195 [Nocardia sp. NBC_01730]